MRIGFLNNQIDNRGTGNALFDYAHYNEEILGNKSAILTLNNAPADELMAAKIFARFKSLRWGGDPNQLLDLDAIYHIKYGTDDGFRPPANIPYLVHAVFDASQPHGDAYAAVSPWLADRYKLEPQPPNYWFRPHVPHIIRPPDFSTNLREELGIPQDALVFGRYGGRDSFDVPFVWSSITTTLRSRNDVYFLFMNTDIPTLIDNWPNRSHIISVEPTADQKRKSAFIMTCDAMLHARLRGETFGIAVGEFDAHGKDIITYGLSPEQAHLDILHNPILYFSEAGLTDILLNYDTLKKYRIWGDMDESYAYFTPERVMDLFKRVLLNENTWSRNRAT